MKKAIFVLEDRSWVRIYGVPEREDIASMVDVIAPRQDADLASIDKAALAQAEIIMTGWGGPRIDEAFLAAAPELKAVFYGAGSIRGIVTDAFWDSGVIISSSWAANAVPVAEYTLSQILFCLKRGWHYAMTVRRDHTYPPRVPVPGGYGSTVGIISLGMIGRRVCQLLAPFDVKVIAYDPFISAEQAAELKIELCSLEDVFRRSDVVSLHTPLLDVTRGMIRREHFAAMKPGASFINTARGAIVREDEMIEVLSARPDIQAVLDVVWPEPPAAESPLYTLPNVALTPHIAGSIDGECRRMGRYMVDELRRYILGQPLQWQVTREQAASMA